jgi:hypothetical protein
MKSGMLTGAGKLPRRLAPTGLPVPAWFHEDTSAALRSLPLKANDVVLASWPKSGTHWVYRAIRLLTLTPAMKEPPMILAEMLPAKEPTEPLPPAPWNPTGTDHFEALMGREDELSRNGGSRLLVSHGTPDLLPSSLEERGKLVYVSRDPRDVVTSNYFFMGTPADGWSGSMDRFTASPEATPNAFGGWYEHVRAFERLASRIGPARALVIEYEAMHTDLPACLRQLAALLGPHAEATLAENEPEIIKQLGFSEMSQVGSHKTFLRKGVSGGWREHFSSSDEARIAAQVAARLPMEREISVCGVGGWRDELLSQHTAAGQ